MHRVGITSFAYFPLSAADAAAASNMVQQLDEEIKSQKASSSLKPGLAEQLEIQLEILKDDTLPDIEIVAFPGLFTGISSSSFTTLFFRLFILLLAAPEPGRSYVTMLCVLNHPISRGTIVCFSVFECTLVTHIALSMPKAKIPRSTLKLTHITSSTMLVYPILSLFRIHVNCCILQIWKA